jgi:hypothetical protein
MGAAIMPVPFEAPARCNCWPGRIADHAAGDQPDRTADQGPRQRPHRAVAKPLLGICDGRQQRYSRDRGRNQKHLRHADAPAHVPAMPMAYHRVRETPCRGFVKKVRTGRGLFRAFAAAAFIRDEPRIAMVRAFAVLLCDQKMQSFRQYPSRGRKAARSSRRRRRAFPRYVRSRGQDDKRD